MFALFDKDGKGFFTFVDLTRVSEQVQGFEVGSILSSENWQKDGSLKSKGKKCVGFDERLETDYSTQKNFRDSYAFRNTFNG